MVSRIQEAGLDVLRKGNEAWKRRRNPPVVETTPEIWSCCLQLGTHKCQRVAITTRQIENLLEYPFTNDQFKAHLDDGTGPGWNQVYICKEDILAHIGNIIPEQCLGSFLAALDSGETELARARPNTPVSLADDEEPESERQPNIAEGAPQKRRYLYPTPSLARKCITQGRHFYGWAVTSAKIHYVFSNLIKADMRPGCVPKVYVENVPSKRSKVPWVKFMRDG